MAIKMVYTLTCDKAHCGSVSSVESMQAVGAEPPMPTIPEGWHVVDGSIYCAYHQVKVE